MNEKNDENDQNINYRINRIQSLLVIVVCEILLLFFKGSILSFLIFIGLIIIIRKRIEKSKHKENDSLVLKNIATILLVLIIVVIPLTKAGNIRIQKMNYLNHIKSVEVTTDNLVDSYVGMAVQTNPFLAGVNLNVIETIEQSNIAIHTINFKPDGVYETLTLDSEGEQLESGIYQLVGNQLTIQLNGNTKIYAVEIKENSYLDDDEPIKFLNLYSDETLQTNIFSGIATGSNDVEFFTHAMGVIDQSELTDETDE
ncbi:hypothetical protein [Acetobacterium woodii]|uniref:Uncharacterized protein n=1 Tax=Acetobacterium woodii (strain ATCC 29683 / DSM 1030 / JCM 2381 / KCTC 1655 / WB1) TaxID=931626 RepID=H6LDF5_ACEWD|nr:hypothetical protein [Acetobacterium woodii]AFA47927.1 hypothetical protein Awo_c11430 [Acetobacterium woodii DSM 1030]